MQIKSKYYSLAISIFLMTVFFNNCSDSGFKIANNEFTDSLGSRSIPTPSSKACSVGIYNSQDQFYRRNRQLIINTFEDLFGTGLVTSISSEIADLPPDSVNGFSYEKFVDSVNGVQSSSYMNLASKAANSLVSSPSALNVYFAKSCNVSADLSVNGCLQNLLNNLGARLFGRALLPVELTAFSNVYTTVVGTPSDKLEATLSVLLQDPRFLFQDLTEENRNQVIANELARLIWFSVPDSALITAAQNSNLKNPAVLQLQIRRMLADEKSSRVILTFLSQWLQFNEIPQFDYGSVFLAGQSITGVRTAMIKETEDFLRQTIIERKGTIQDLYLSQEALVSDSALAKIYGISASTNWQKLPDERAGILTRAAVLSSGNDSVNTIMRGVHLTRDILCNTIPNPSADVIDMRPVGISYTDYSSRDYATIRTSGTSCIGCHSMINPPAFALSGFDSIGRSISSERIFNQDGSLAKTFTVNSRVNLPLDNSSVTIDGAHALSVQIANSRQGSECLSKQMFRYFTGKLESEANNCGLQDMGQKLRRGMPILSVLEEMIISEVALLK